MARNYVDNNRYSMDDEKVIHSKISNATKKVQQFGVFPQITHVKTVVLMAKKA